MEDTRKRELSRWGGPNKEFALLKEKRKKNSLLNHCLDSWTEWMGNNQLYSLSSVVMTSTFHCSDKIPWPKWKKVYCDVWFQRAKEGRHGSRYRKLSPHIFNHKQGKRASGSSDRILTLKGYTQWCTSSNMAPSSKGSTTTTNSANSGYQRF